LSWQATAYVKDLLTCPDGARLSRGQKLLAFTLADYHNTHRHAAWPSIPTLAREALISLAQAKRDLAYLEEHLLIRKVRPEKMGRGWVCAYEFLALDTEKELVKGVHHEPLFCAQESGSKGAHREQQSGSEGVQKGLTVNNAIRKSKEPEQKESKEQHACGAALKDWFSVKQELENRLPAEQFNLWLRPMYLLKVMSGNVLLLSLPANGRIIQAACKRESSDLLQQTVQQFGYGGFTLTRYPDDYERDRIRDMYPDFYEQMFGNHQIETVTHSN
jgi:hypothetical protein